MKHRLPRKKETAPPLNTTFCLADAEQVDPESGTSIPSESGVEEAKDWVEHNKK